MSTPLPVVEFGVNNQPAEKVDHRKDHSLELVEVWKTIQGEGPFAGEPAVFVRLAGCNLKCPKCDTDYTTGRLRFSSAQVVSLVEDAQKRYTDQRKARLVVFTGGEPFRQNFAEVCRNLISLGHVVQVETNGTLYYDDFPWVGVTLVCSPKTPAIHPSMKLRIMHWKYVLQAGEVDPKDGLPTRTLEGHRPWRPQEFRPSEQCYVQPLDEGDPAKNKANLEAAVASCMKFGYRLSIQLHKIAGVP